MNTSLCIPRALNNVNHSFVYKVFERIFGPDTIERVDIVPSRDFTSFCKIFVHLRFWPDNYYVNNIKLQLIQFNFIKIVYHSPYFWKCFISRIPKPTY